MKGVLDLAHQVNAGYSTDVIGLVGRLVVNARPMEQTAIGCCPEAF